MIGRVSCKNNAKISKLHKTWHGQKGILRVLAKLLYFEIRTVSDVALVMFLNGSAAGTQHSWNSKLEVAYLDKSRFRLGHSALNNAFMHVYSPLYMKKII